MLHVTVDVANLNRLGESDTPATWIPRLAAGPLDFQPDTQWAYSGTVGLDVVAGIIEIVSAIPLNEFVQKRIFDPLAMNDTHWIVPKKKLDRTMVIKNDKGAWIKSFAYFSGSIGLISTARDYVHFQHMYHEFRVRCTQEEIQEPTRQNSSTPA